MLREMRPGEENAKHLAIWMENLYKRGFTDILCDRERITSTKHVFQSLASSVDC